MRRCRSKARGRLRTKQQGVIWGLCACSFATQIFGCISETSKERRELRELEAVIGLLANAPAPDRAVRLEQLDGLKVQTERISGLKRLCVSAYRSFERASSMLTTAKIETAKVESDIAEAREKKAMGETLSPAEEQRLRESGARAASSISKVTKELDLAEGYVAACEKKRQALKAELISQ